MDRGDPRIVTDIAGKGVANPVAMILSVAMLLDWVGTADTRAGAEFEFLVHSMSFSVCAFRAATGETVLIDQRPTNAGENRIFHVPWPA